MVSVHDPDALRACVSRSDARAAEAAKKGAPPGTLVVALSVPEIRHLFVHLVFQQIPPDPGHIIATSRWRRAHQANARRGHYRARRR